MFEAPVLPWPVVLVTVALLAALTGRAPGPGPGPSTAAGISEGAMGRGGRP